MSREKRKAKRKARNARRRDAELAEKILQRMSTQGTRSYLDRVAQDLYSVCRLLRETDAELIARLQSFGNRFVR